MLLKEAEDVYSIAGIVGVMRIGPEIEPVGFILLDIPYQSSCFLEIIPVVRREILP